MVELFAYGDQMLCKANCCHQEEVEKDSEKHIIDEQKLDDYRDLIARTKTVPPSTY